ncbi:hypothetical protein [Streptomyces sp. NPDC089795]|uniref:hypothetical protein n=1 Tax=Streptomyces sp. NPDC089795 TaxID=3155297 RepID=UPI003440B1A8
MGSRDADIDFTFFDPTTVRAVFDALTPAGWSAEEAPGCVRYLINDAADLYDWSAGTPERLDELLTELDSPAHLPYVVCLNIYAPRARTGGTLMFHPGRTEVSFSPVIDRRRIPGAPEFTDLAWYLHALVPCLVTAGLKAYEAREIRW